MLYKFRRELDRFTRSIIADHMLWFASFSTLNDPFEYELQIDDESAMKWAVSQVMAVKGVTQAQAQREIKEATQAGKFGIAKGQLGVREKITSGSSALCLSTVWDEAVLWANYADESRGLVLGFEFPARTASFDPRPTAGRIVEYYSVAPTQRMTPKGFPLEVLKLFFQKRETWKHEKEYRFVKFAIDDETVGGYAARYPSECLKEILVREAAADAMIEEIKAITDVPIIRVAPNSSTYRLERIGRV